MKEGEGRGSGGEGKDLREIHVGKNLKKTVTLVYQRKGSARYVACFRSKKVAFCSGRMSFATSDALQISPNKQIRLNRGPKRIL